MIIAYFPKKMVSFSRSVKNNKSIFGSLTASNTCNIIFIVTHHTSHIKVLSVRKKGSQHNEKGIIFASYWDFNWPLKKIQKTKVSSSDLVVWLEILATSFFAWLLGVYLIILNYASKENINNDNTVSIGERGGKLKGYLGKNDRYSPCRNCLII